MVQACHNHPDSQLQTEAHDLSRTVAFSNTLQPWVGETQADNSDAGATPRKQNSHWPARLRTWGRVASKL
eukprot:6097719-Pyramimonas_sp.AAC.1